jgi:hypothetical protein
MAVRANRLKVFHRINRVFPFYACQVTAMVNVNVALAKLTIDFLKVEIAYHASWFWTVVSQTSGSGLRITLIGVHHDLLYGTFDILLRHWLFGIN